MEQSIQPIGDKPVLMRKGAAFTRIIVDQVQDADGEKYHVMFIGTGVCVFKVLSVQLNANSCVYLIVLECVCQRVNIICCFHSKRGGYNAESCELRWRDVHH